MSSSPLNKKYLILIALLVGLAGGSIYGILFNSTTAAEHTILVGKDGFNPSSLSIKQGDAVTFVSDGTVEAFWPASDSHPTHGIYPEFDPKQPIPADESWTFVFQKTGLWKAHDHMNSHIKGEIVVYSQEGASTDECLERSAGSTKFQPNCWESEFNNLLKKEGEANLFATINSYIKTDEMFKNNCHDVMHIVGKIIYQNYTKTGQLTFNNDLTNCGYGFFHGFVESIYSNTGSYDLSRKFCDDLDASEHFLSTSLERGAVNACWHGIGHAIFDSQDSRAWGDAKEMSEQAIRECEAVFIDNYQREICASGVFNALDVAFSNNLYGLSYNENAPFLHCIEFPDNYKNRCLIDIAAFYTSYKNLNRDEALKLFRTVEAKYFTDMMASWVADNIQWRSTTTEEAYKEAAMCFEFVEQKDINACVKAIHLGIFKKNGPLLNQSESNKICDLFVDTIKKTKCQEFIYIRDRDV